MAITATQITTEKKEQALINNSAYQISIEKIGLKAGLISCVSLITYFIIMKYFNFMSNAIAWTFNFIILWVGIIFACRYYRSKTQLNVEYLPGLILGGITTAVTVIPFVLFIYIYFSQIDSALLQLLKNNILFMGERITPVTAAISTMIEGICSGVIISFMVMQYFKSGFRRARKERFMYG
jgi:hypothetical protein